MAVTQRRKQWWAKAIGLIESGYSMADAAKQVKRQAGTLYNEYSYVPAFRREVDAARLRYHTNVADAIERIATLELEHIANDLEAVRDLDIEKRPLQRSRIIRTLLTEMLPHHQRRADRLRDNLPAADPWLGPAMQGASTWTDFTGDDDQDDEFDEDEPNPPS